MVQDTGRTLDWRGAGAFGSASGPRGGDQDTAGLDSRQALLDGSATLERRMELLPHRRIEIVRVRRSQGASPSGQLNP
jgi:hypothetical protein